jgi:type VI secretion system protein
VIYASFVPEPRHRARPPRSLLPVAVCAAVALFAASCHIPPLSLFFGGETRLDVAVSPHLNGDAPVAVEVVFAYDKAVYAQLLTMSAKTWFASRDQFLRDHANGKREIESQMWQWVPGQVVPAMPLEYHVGARGGIIFAGYASSGDHRQTFDPQQNVRLELGDHELSVAQSG